jgi:hypothetical protein
MFCDWHSMTNTMISYMWTYMLQVFAYKAQIHVRKSIPDSCLQSEEPCCNGKTSIPGHRMGWSPAVGSGCWEFQQSPARAAAAMASSCSAAASISRGDWPQRGLWAGNTCGNLRSLVPMYVLYMSSDLNEFGSFRVPMTRRRNFMVTSGLLLPVLVTPRRQRRSGMSGTRRRERGKGRSRGRISWLLEYRFDR